MSSITLTLTIPQHAWLVSCVRMVISQHSEILQDVSEDGLNPDFDTAREVYTDLQQLKELDRVLQNA